MFNFLHYFAEKEGSDNRPVKMVFLVNSALRMGKGKTAAQVGHAAIKAYKHLTKNSTFQVLNAWENQGQPKVCLRCENREALENFKKAFSKRNIETFSIYDAGKTQVPNGSLTVVAVGPFYSDEIDEVTGTLKLL